MHKEEKSELYSRLANECMREGRYEEAVILYRKLVETHPGADSFLLSLAWAYHDSGKLDDAIQCFEQLLANELKREIFTGFAYDELIRIFKAEGLYDRQIDICKKVVAVQPNDTGFLGDLGEAYLRAGKADKAVEIYERIIGIDPEATNIFCNLGNALIATGDFERGEEAYQKAAGIDSTEAGSFYNKLADTYCMAGYNEKAELAQRKSIKYRIDEPIYYLNLGDILIKEEKFDDAKASYEEAIHLNPAAAGIYYNRLGNSLARSCHHSQAIEAFLQAIDMDPNNPFYYIHISRSYSHLGLTDKAEEAIKKSEILRRKIKRAPSS